jgi:phenylalanyl-tRNA synthetase beta chain
VITTSFIENTLKKTYEVQGAFGSPVMLINAPDPDCSMLRPTLLPNLVSYALASLGTRQERIALFEIGKRYKTEGNAKKETPTLAILLAGKTQNSSYDIVQRNVTVNDLKGILQTLSDLLGKAVDSAKTKNNHPSLDAQLSLTLQSGDMPIGSLGLLDQSILPPQKREPMFVAEIDLASLIHARQIDYKPYVIAPPYPPLIEDLTFTVPPAITVRTLINAITSIDPLIHAVRIKAIFNTNYTFRIVYQSKEKTLTDIDTKHIRSTIIKRAQTLGALFREK